MEDVILYEGILEKIFYIFLSCNSLAINFQSWTMDKYITWKQFSSFTGALHAGSAVCTGAHWDKIGDTHRGFSDGVATERGEEAASASATAPRWRRRYRS
jgi:hypothetical protein